MTRDEFLSTMTSFRATIAPGGTARDIELMAAGLQRMRAAIAPAWLRDFYAVCGGVILGNAVIFGPKEIENGLQHPVPTVIQVNDEIANMESMRGMTVWGRNDLFWFALDTMGTCYMLDNTTLRKLRKYDDPYRAMGECMAVGRL